MSSTCNIGLTTREQGFLYKVKSNFIEYNNENPTELLNSINELSDYILESYSNYIGRTPITKISKIFKQLGTELKKQYPQYDTLIENAINDSTERFIEAQNQCMKYSQIESFTVNNNPNNFINLIRNPKLNSELEAKTRAEFTYNLIDSLLSGGGVDYNITLLLENYIKKLYDYVNDNNNQSEFNVMEFINSENYTELFTKAYNKISTYISLNSGPQQLHSTSIAMREAIEILRVLHILNNFDKILQKYCGDFIFTLPSLEGKVIVAGKYSLRQKGKQFKSYNNESDKSSSEDITTKLLQLMWNTIPDGKGGTLNQKDFEVIIKEIQAVYNKDLQNKKIDLDFIYNTLKHKLPFNLRKTGKIVAKWLEEQDTLFKKKYNQSTVLSEQVYLTKYFNFSETFLYQCRVRQNVAYSQVERESIIIKQPEIHKKDKQYIFKGIIKTLKQNFVKSPNYNFIVWGDYIRVANLPVTSDEYIKYLNKITGLHLDKESIQRFISEDVNTEKIIKLFVKEYSDFIIQLKSKIRSNVSIQNVSNKSIVEQEVNNLIHKQSYKHFTDIITSNNYTSVMKVLDLEAKQQPNSAIPNNFQSFHDIITDNNNDYLNNNIFCEDNGVNTTPSKYGKTCKLAYRQGVDTGRKVVAPEKLSAFETLQLSLNAEFLNAACTSDTVFFQPVCYADKVRIGLLGLNPEAVSKKYKFKTGALQYKLHIQRRSYYNSLKASILKQYEKLNSYHSSIQDLVEWIQTEEGQNFIRKNKNQLREGIDFIKSSDGKYSFNYLQYCYILDAELQFEGKDNFINNIIKEDLEKFKDDAKDIPLPDFISDRDFILQHADKLLNLFEIDVNDQKAVDTFYEVLQDQEVVTWGDLDSKLNNKDIYRDNKFSILEKYFYMSNICEEGFLQISGLVYSSYADKNQHNEFDPNNINTNYIKKVIDKNIRSGTKRHNFFTGSYQTPILDSEFGIKETSQYIVVDDFTQKLRNYSGDSHTQEVHDGAGWAIAIQSIWEQNSYPETEPGSTMKAIGLMPTGFNARQIKYAQYSLTNEVLRNSFGDEDVKGDGSYFNLKFINKRFLQSGKFTLEERSKLITALLNQDTVKITVDCYIEQNNVFYQLDHFVNNNGVISSVWKNGDQEIVITNNLQNVYDLWALFGKENVFQNINGNMVESEISMETLAHIISKWTPDIKTRMYTKIIPRAILKTGPENVHTIEELYESKELHPITWNNRYIGLQQEFGHSADDSDIPSPTQLFNNIAFNGQHPELVEQAWESLAVYIERSLDKYDYVNKSKNIKEAHKKVAKFLIKKLRTSNVTQDNLYSLINRALDGTGSLLLSDQSLFFKFASDLIVQLNHTSIKFNMRGIAIIQNPSHAAVGVYETSNGEVLMQTDYNKAQRQVNTARLNTLKDAPCTIQELAIEDVVSYWDQVKNEEVVVRIKNIDDLKDLEKISATTKLYKKHGVKRNLKSPQVTYTIGNEKYSWWLAPWTVARWELEKNGTRKHSDFKSKQHCLDVDNWYLECLKGLEQGYIYESLDNFKAGIQTKITSYDYTPGEQLLPKVFKTNFGIKDGVSLQDVLDGGPDFFSKSLKRTYQEKDPNNYKGDNIALIYKDFKVYYQYTPETKGVKIELHEDNTVEEYGVKWYVENGEKLFIIPKHITSIQKHDSNYLIDVSKNDSVLNDLEKSEDCIGALLYTNGTLNKKGLVGDKNIRRILDKFNPFLYKKLSRGEQLNKILYDVATKKFESFKHTLDTVSIRIPTQAFQSFMRNKTVGFLESDTNDGYINIMQIWFTGGDYDIDKSYTLMYDVSDNGILTTTSSLIWEGLSLDECFDLKLPNKNFSIEINEDTSGNFNQAHLSKFYSGIEVELYKIYLKYDNINPVTGFSYDALKEAIELTHKLDQSISINIEDPGFKKLLQAINIHNNTRITNRGLQNRMTNAFIRCSGSISNLHASQQPMTSDFIVKTIDATEEQCSKLRQEAIEKVDKEYNRLTQNEGYDKAREEDYKREVKFIQDFFSDSSKRQFSAYNPIDKWRIQREATIGKEDVGISANAIKVNSALQQYYNQYYRSWDGTYNNIEGINPLYKVNIPINITAFGSTIISKHIVRFGDTVLDKDRQKALKKFKLLYADVDVTTEKDYNKLLSNNNQDDLVLSFKYFKGLNEKDDIKKSLTKDSYLEWLFYKEQLDTRISDNLSIFISLAVDNMKEMQLSRIYCTEDLLPIPLTLIMLGVSPSDTMLFCKTILKPIYERLEVNRFQNKKPSIEEILNEIERSGELVFSNDSNENSNTIKQLRTLLNVSNNNNTLAKIFHINQGVTATYGDLAKEYLDLENTLNNSLEGDEDYIDLYELFVTKDPEYIQRIVSSISSKNNSSYNVIDVLLKTPHFRMMHEAVQRQLQNIRQLSSRAYIVQGLNKNLRVKKQIKVKDARRLQYLYDHFVIGKTLQNLELFTFTKERLEQNLGVTLDDLHIPSTKVFKLTSNDNIDNFIKIMDNVIIPRLKNLYPNNYAIQSLQQSYDSNIDKTIYDIPFQKFAKNNVEESNNLKKAISEFSFIANSPSGLVNVDGHPISIIDALNVYQMILKRDSVSSFKDLITENDSDSIVSKTKNGLIELYDSNVYNHYANGEPIHPDLEKILNNHELINAVLGESSTLNLSGVYIYTFASPKFDITRNEAISLLKKTQANIIEHNDGSNRVTIQVGKNTYTRVIPEIVSASDLNSIILDIDDRYTKLLRETRVIPDTDLKSKIAKRKSIIKLLQDIIPNFENIQYNKIINTKEYKVSTNVSKIGDVLSFNVNIKSDFKDVENEELLYAALQYKFGNDLTKHIQYLQSSDADTKLIESYSTYYLNNNQTKLDLILAKDFLEKSSQYLNNIEVFYSKPTTIKEGDIKEGDLIIVGDVFYIYSGVKKGEHQLISTETGEILYSSPKTYKGRKLDVPFGYVLDSVPPPNIETTQETKFTKIPIGSLVEIDGKKYKLLRKFSDRYILVNDQRNFEILPTSKINRLRNYKYEALYNENLYGTTIELEDLKNSNKYLIYIQPGDKIYKGNQEYIVESIEKDKIIVEGNTYDLQDFTKVILSNRILTSDFEHESCLSSELITPNYTVTYTQLNAKPKLKKGDIIRRGALNITDVTDISTGKVKDVFGRERDYREKKGGGPYPANYTYKKVEIKDIAAKCSPHVLYKVIDTDENGYVVVEELTHSDFIRPANSLQHLSHSIKVYKPEPEDVFYTRNYDSIYDDALDAVTRPVSQQDSNYTVASQIISRLDSLGLKLVYTNGDTRFEGNTIFINENHKEDILYYATHELTHLALANLKLNSKEAYLQLISYINNNENDIISKYSVLASTFASIDENQNYPTDIERAEEKLIRFMEYQYKLRSNIEQGVFTNLSQIEKYFSDSLNKMGFKLKGGTIIDSILHESFNLNNFNLEQIYKDSALNEVLNDIKYKCDE